MSAVAQLLLLCVCLAQPDARPATHADAAASLQREIDRQIDATLPAIQSSPVIRLPKGRFVLKRPISFRGTWGGKLVGQGYGTVLEADFRKEDRGKPMIDLTGCTRFHIADLKIVGGPYTNPTDRATPGVGLLLARRAGESAGFHVIERVHFEGRFAIAGLANIASEVNVFRDCTFTNHQVPSGWTDDGAPLGGYGVLIANHNYRHLLDVAIGAETMLEITFDNCSFGLECADLDGKPTGGGAGIMIAGAEARSLGDIFFVGGGAGMKEAKAAVLMHAEGTSGQLDRIVFERMRWEINECECALLGISKLPRVIGPVMWRDCSVYVGKQFAHFTGMAGGFGMERTLLVRVGKRFKDYSGPAIEADRTQWWDVGMPLGFYGWPKLIAIHKSASGDRYVVPTKDAIDLPESNVSDVSVEVIRKK